MQYLPIQLVKKHLHFRNVDRIYILRQSVELKTVYLYENC